MMTTMNTQCVVWRDPSHANTRPIYQSAPATQATALSPVVTPLLKRDPTPPFSSQTLHLLFFQARVRAARCLWAWSWTAWPTRASSSRRVHRPPSRPAAPSVTFICYHFQWCFWNLRKSHDIGGDSNNWATTQIPSLFVFKNGKQAVTQWSRWDDYNPNFSWISLFLKNPKTLRNQIFSVFLS